MSNEQLRVSHRCKLELEKELSQMRIQRDRCAIELQRMSKLVDELQAVHFVCLLSWRFLSGSCCQFGGRSADRGPFG